MGRLRFSGLLFEGQAYALMLGQYERLKRAENPLLVNGFKLSCHNTFIVTGRGFGSRGLFLVLVAPPQSFALRLNVVAVHDAVAAFHGNGPVAGEFVSQVSEIFCKCKLAP